MKSYAQNCEDLIIKTILPNSRGFYVDVGANHPDTDSVTKLFYENGWKGINIEPIPRLYKELSTKRPKDVNLNVGISNKNGTLKLREFTGETHGLSTFSPSVKKSFNNGRGSKQYKDYAVSVRTLKDVFQDLKVKEIDFLKVDVEGLEYEVLSGNDWSQWRPKLVIIENTPGKWAKYMLDLGYDEVFFDGLNRYYATPELHSKLELIFKDLYLQIVNDLGANRDDAGWGLSGANGRSIKNNPEDYLPFSLLSKALGKQVIRRIGGSLKYRRKTIVAEEEIPTPVA